VVVCCGQRFARIGLRAILDREPAITVVAEASDEFELSRAVATHHPDVVVMEERLSAHVPEADVVILVEHTNPDTLLALLRTHARGVVHRDAPLDDLVCAVHAVATGDAFVSPGLMGTLMQVVQAVLPRPRGTVPSRDPLTRRESEVLGLLCQGMANREIATALRLSQKTVKFHVSNVLAKTNMRTRAQLIAFAVTAPGPPPDPAR
jgi:DNA-binding NarL/FixJ family response regulator